MDHNQRFGEGFQGRGGTEAGSEDRLALNATTGESVTFLLHTRGRPEFLLRALKYFDHAAAGTDLRLIVLDGSDDADWQQIEQRLQQLNFVGHIDFRHAASGTPLLDRLLAGVEDVLTPYVAFAANDDFYLPGWLDEAVEQLNRRSDIGTIHGHAIFFSLSAYVAHAAMRQYFVHPRLDPPISWLEAEIPTERIASVTDGTHGPSVPGWYALQRTSQLRRALRGAASIALPADYLEYWLVFYQAVLGKTRLLDRIIIARQLDPEAFHPAPDLRNARRWVPIIKNEFLKLLKEHQPLSDEEARAVVDRYLGGVISEIRWGARRGRLTHLLRRTAGLRTVWRALRGAPLAAELAAGAYPDPRLPPLPPMSDDHPAVRLITRWTSE